MGKLDDCSTGLQQTIKGWVTGDCKPDMRFESGFNFMMEQMVSRHEKIDLGIAVFEAIDKFVPDDKKAERFNELSLKVDGYNQQFFDAAVEASTAEFSFLNEPSSAPGL